jgi:hypothetical protein
MPAKHNHTSFGVRPRDRYMRLQRLNLACISYFAIGFLILGIMIPLGPFAIAKVSPRYSHNVEPLLHHTVS